jgi:Holliday junction resolvase RusA-like endonuclease
MPSWTFNLKPTPASRLRVSRYGTYYGKNYTRFRKIAEALIPDTVGKKHKPYDDDTPLSVHLLISVPKPKSGSDKLWPRGDVDNFAKGVLDSCNGIVWKDDDSITKLTIEKVWGDPKIVLTVTPPKARR